MLSVYLGVDWIFVDDLSSKKRYAEAATVLLDYAGDVRQAVIAYVEGNFFADARRIVSSSTFTDGDH
jgi:elongator complex protein 1